MSPEISKIVQLPSDKLVSFLEIDPARKYVLETPYLLSAEVAERIKKAWEDFVSDPNQHMFILDRGLVLKKIIEE